MVLQQKRNRFIVLLAFVLLIGCGSLSAKDAPPRHKITPRVSGTIYLVNGDRVEVVNAIVSVTPEVIRVESTMVRYTILVENVKYIVLFNLDHQPRAKNQLTDNPQ